MRKIILSIKNLLEAWSSLILWAALTLMLFVVYYLGIKWCSGGLWSGVWAASTLVGLIGSIAHSEFEKLNQLQEENRDLRRENERLHIAYLSAKNPLKRND